MIAVALDQSDDGDAGIYEPLRSTSFDVGPTLHQWIERYAPDVDRAIAYQVGHAANPAGLVAVAAPLVHAIMPLAKMEDRERLIAWGIADFVQRFGGSPLAMWLPETAVDLATLDLLSRRGIKYTILMANQAVRARAIDGEWHDVTSSTIDTTKAYVVKLSEGRTINVVFGQAELSQQVAFGDIVEDGSKLADTMIEALAGDDNGVVMLVTDGETFGHHHHFGELGMTWAIRRLDHKYAVETSLGAWLATNEPGDEIELAEVSAWSCAHGVERWRSECGCVTGEQPGWRQEWRKPLREALDWLRETLGHAVDEELALYVTSIDEALIDYGRVLTGALTPSVFVQLHQMRSLKSKEQVKTLELFEIHRNLLYSFTSCAWFFADPAEIETAIVLRYAAVALELAQRALGLDLTSEFLSLLDDVHSNKPGIGGSEIWHAACDRYRVDEARVVAGFAAERLANPDGPRMERGFWHLEPRSRRKSDEKDVSRVILTHAPTLRQQEFALRVEREGLFNTKVRVKANGADEWQHFALPELGDDVVALVAMSWLVEPGSVDAESALNRLLAEMLTREVTASDASVVVALASAMRFVTPGAEASIRRALVLISNASRAPGDWSALIALAQTLGMGQLVDSSRGFFQSH
jgi:hypothetical protein